MKDFLTNILFEISDESEKRTSKVVIKLLYYLDCVIIATWIGSKLGFKFNDLDISYRSLVNFFAELQIVVPILILLFTITISRTITKVVILAISLAIQLTLYLTYFGRKSIIIHLLNEEVIDKDLRKGKCFDSYLKSMNNRKKMIDENSLQFDYYSTLLITLWFMYCFIVSDKFPSLYFTWINVVLTIWTFFMLSLIGVLTYIDNKIREIRKKLKTIDLPTE